MTKSRDPKKPDLKDLDNLSAPLLRGLFERRLSRRQFLQFGGTAAAAAALGTFGIPAHAAASSNLTAAGVKAFWAKQKKNGVVRWANWPLYMDLNPNNKSDHPTLDHFTKQTGIKVKYFEVIQSDASFFAHIRPSLQSGQDIGYDMAIVQNDQFFLAYRDLGLLRQLDQKRMPNFYANAGKMFQNRGYDEGNKWSMPWQAGMTGIGYSPEHIKEPINSWQDLANPKYKGKVGLFGNTVDLPNAALLAVGVDPLKSTPADWKKAAEWIDKVKLNVRKFYGQDYISALVRGDIWITMAYSGDIFQENLAGQNLKFVMPKEKATLWIDNMILFRTAKNPVDAMELMDFYYEPRQAADLTETVNYISPVPKAKELILADAKSAGDPKQAKYLEAVAKSFAVFPTEADFARTAEGRIPKPGEELAEWNATFEPTYQAA